MLNRRFGSHHFRPANFPHARRRGPGCRSVGASPASAHTLGRLLAVRRDIEVTRSRAFNWLTVTGTPHERCGRRQSNVGDIARGLLQVGGLRPNPGEQQDRGHLNHAAIDGHGPWPARWRARPTWRERRPWRCGGSAIGAPAAGFGGPHRPRDRCPGSGAGSWGFEGEAEPPLASPNVIHGVSWLMTANGS